MIALPPPDPVLELSIASEGMSKGLLQTDGPQLLVRPGLVSGPMFIAVYLKNVAFPEHGAEAGMLVGARHRFGGIDFTVSAGRKFLVGMSQAVDSDAWEFNFSARRAIGPVTVTGSATYSPDDLGGSTSSVYLEAGASYRLGNHWSLVGAVERRERGGGIDYTAFNGGIALAATRHFTAELRYFSNDHDELGGVFEPRLVATLGARF